MADPERQAKYAAAGSYNVCVFSSANEDEARAVGKALEIMCFVSDYGYDVRREATSKESDFSFYTLKEAGIDHLWKVFIHESIKKYSNTWGEVGHLVTDFERGMKAGIELAASRAAAEAAKPKKRAKRTLPECPYCHSNEHVGRYSENGRQAGYVCLSRHGCGRFGAAKSGPNRGWEDPSADLSLQD